MPIEITYPGVYLEETSQGFHEIEGVATSIADSLERTLNWVVFELNDESLWRKVRSTADDFMNELFRCGSLQGTKPSDAYFVKCDRSTMTQNDIDNGVVNVVVGFAPLKPAEFVIIRIQQMAAKTSGAMNRPIGNTMRLDPYKGFKFRIRPRMRRPNRRDLQLSNHAHEILDHIVEHVRRDELLADLKPKDGSVLFLGPRGTGKTLAAEVVADELGRELYRVDLSKIVSKYIGETEKHLKRIFAAAEATGAVLFFDEADALFGKRSEVKDAHDRYANTDVAYFLQRIEDYYGLVILATNRKSNIDDAFQRRIRFVVDFGAPLRN
jgi:hypothetical protein